MNTETDTPKRKRAKQENGASPSTLTPKLPTSVTRRLRGHTFEVPFKPEWVEGHALTADEALFINSARISFMLSAYGDVVTKLTDKEREGGPLSEDEVQAHAREYFSNYEWQPRSESVPLDPVEAEIRRLAWVEITHQARAKGKTTAGVTREVKQAATDKYLERHFARLKEAAEANLANAAEFGDEDFLAEIGVRDLKSASADEAAS